MKWSSLRGSLFLRSEKDAEGFAGEVGDLNFEQPVEKLSSFKTTSIGKLYSSNILRDPVKEF